MLPGVAGTDRCGAVYCPSDATSRVNQIVSGRRGQLLGFDGRDGWAGWDVVRPKCRNLRSRT